MIGACVVAARNAPMPTEREDAQHRRRTRPDPLHQFTEEVAQARPGKERRREHAAHRARAERRRRGQELAYASTASYSV